MIVIGFNLETAGFRYTVLEGTKENPILIEKQKVSKNETTNTSELMDWYETSFQNILDKFQPKQIGLKLNLNGKKSQIPLWYYPYGILHKLAHTKNIPVTEFLPANFTSSKFGLDKSVDIYKYIDEKIGNNPPHWDKSQKSSVLSAWMVL